MISTLIVSAALVACGGGGDAAADSTGFQTAAAAAETSATGSGTAPPAPAAEPAAATSGAPTIPPPVVFNATRSARAGDIVGVQGENFGSTPLVWLEAMGSTPATALPVLNQVGTGWLAVQIPAGATGALALRIGNGSSTSALVRLNAATPHHLDATQLVPGGAFRVFGRNLRLPGSTPTLTVGGLPASIDLAASDEHMLVATAPAGLPASSATVVSVDNGNGSGATALDRSVAAVTGASGDPLSLGVGWAAGFAPLLARRIDAATDSRLPSRVLCNGQADDSPALQAALVLADKSGGGVVTLPAGTCRLGAGVQIFSRTVLQGAGKGKTVLQHTGDSPIYGYSADLVAVRNLALTNTGTAANSSLLLKFSTRVAVQGVTLNLGAKAKAWLYGNTNIVIRDSDFLQTGGIDAPGAAHLSGNVGLSFVGNKVSFLNNTGSDFHHVSDAHIQGNTWTRDASRQSDPGVVHTVAINFAHRLALVGNTFTTINGPVDQAKNDSETILTEGGGPSRTEGLGTVASATPTTLFDPAGSVHPNAMINGALPENYGVAIVAGKGAGQTRRVTAFKSGTFTVDRAWDVQPDAGSRYATAVWGIEKALIKGNLLSHNPRGIWLYSTAAREVDIVGNTMLENGGILVRAFQSVAQNWFSPIFNVRVDGNTISNSTRRYMSNMGIHFANLDGLAVGTSHIGVEVRRNALTANDPNLTVSYFGHAAMEGYLNQMNVSARTYEETAMPRLLGTILQGNTCTRCATAFRLSTGAAGTMLFDNTLVDSGALWMNSRTTSSTEVARNTQVQ